VHNVNRRAVNPRRGGIDHYPSPNGTRRHVAATRAAPMTGVPAMINSNARQRIVSLLTGPQPYAPSPGALSSLSRSEASRLATPRERRLTASETGLHAAQRFGGVAPPLERERP